MSLSYVEEASFLLQNVYNPFSTSLIDLPFDEDDFTLFGNHEFEIDRRHDNKFSDFCVNSQDKEQQKSFHKRFIGGLKKNSGSFFESETQVSKIDQVITEKSHLIDFSPFKNHQSINPPSPLAEMQKETKKSLQSSSSMFQSIRMQKEPIKTPIRIDEDEQAASIRKKKRIVMESPSYSPSYTKTGSKLLLDDNNIIPTPRKRPPVSNTKVKHTLSESRSKVNMLKEMSQRQSKPS